MEYITQKDYKTIFGRFGFFLTLPTAIIIFFHYLLVVPIITNNVKELPYLIIFSFIILNSVLGIFFVYAALKPVREHIQNPTDKTQEIKAYRAFCNLPNGALIYLQVVVIFTICLDLMSFDSPAQMQQGIILEIAFLSMMVAIIYLFANHRVSFYLKFFAYLGDAVKISMKRRIMMAMNWGILGILISGIYVFYLSLDNPTDAARAGIFAVLVLIPATIYLTKTVLTITIEPTIRIINAWEQMNKTRNNSLPNICLGEMATLTHRFNLAMESAQSQLKENQELSQELSGVANDLSASAEVVSSTAESIASSQQFIAKGATSQTNSILNIQRKINLVATGVQSTQEKISHINNISNTIKSIAGQTNILALNAAIEAARAGEAGRGFNVVADQVRKLAEESRNAVNTTDNMVKEIQSVSENQKHLMTELLHEVGELSTIAEETSANTEEVSAAAEEQSASMQQISGSAIRIANLASMLTKIKSISIEKAVEETNGLPKVMHLTASDIKHGKSTPKVVLPLESLYNSKN